MEYSYIVTENITITRQAGDTGRIEFILPDMISLDEMTIRLHVYRKGGNTLVFKKEGDDWEVEGQKISASLNNSDTAKEQGLFWWELEIQKGKDRVITIAKGDFVILRELVI